MTFRKFERLDTSHRLYTIEARLNRPHMLSTTRRARRSPIERQAFSDSCPQTPNAKCPPQYTIFVSVRLSLYRFGRKIGFLAEKLGYPGIRDSRLTIPLLKEVICAGKWRSRFFRGVRN